MRQKTAPLFNEPPESGAQAATGSAAGGASELSVQPSGQAPVSAAAKAFNLQLKRIDKLKSQLAELLALEQSHRLAVHEQLTPLRTRHVQAMREMVLFLDQRLAGSGLSGPQRKTATELLCDLAITLVEGGDDDMVDVHDRHSPQSVKDMEREEAEDLREQFERTFGQPLDEELRNASAEDVFNAGLEQLRQKLEEDLERQQTAARQRKSRKKPSAAQLAAAAQMEDAQSSLRKLYRQLASALHPDREPDAKARLAKTALMSEANAAYERKDLVALMQIQHRAALADPLAAAQLSEDKLATLTRLLKEQVAQLERERAMLRDGMEMQFAVPMGMGMTARSLQQGLLLQRLHLEQTVAAMDADLERIQDDKQLKRWLNQQRKIALAQEAQDEFDDGFIF